MQNIRVMIVEDQKSICQQLQQWLEPVSDIQIVATATDGATAINLIESVQPDIVLMDLNMPGMDGLEAIKVISRQFPECKVLVLSSSKDKDDIQRSLQAGAKGYILKNNSAEEMVNSIRSAGKSYFQLSPGLFNEIFLPILNSETDVNVGEPASVVPKIRVMIVEDQKYVCKQLQQWLKSKPDIEIVAIATDGASAINLIESVRPDIVLMDLNMPGMDGFESIEIIGNRFPECKVLVLTISDNKDDIQRALKAGATGYLLKTNSAEEMVNSIRSAGKSYFQLSPGLFTQIFLPKLDSETDDNAEKSNSLTTSESDKQKGSSSKEENKNKMFRQESLERLSSPERLDQLMRVVNPKAWIPLTTLGFLSVVALAWSIFGRIPVTVQGAGVLIYPSTVVPLQAKNSGQLLKLNAKEGELVEKGEVIATIDRSDLREQLIRAKNKLAQVKNQNSEANSVQVLRKEQDLRAIKEQRQSLEERLQIIQELTPTLKDKGLSAIQRQRQNLQQRQKALEGLRPTFELRFKTRENLFQSGAISQDVLLEAKQEYLNNIGSIDEVKANLKELDVQESEAYQQYLSNLNEVKSIQAQIQELDSELANLNQQDNERSTTRTREVQEVKREIAQIEQEINSESQIVSQHSGKILELTVNPGQVIEAGTRLASVNTDKQADNLVGMTYFPVADGKKVKPGMEIQITPQTIKRERFGGIVGTVTKVSPFPVTAEAAANVVGSPEIITGLVPETQPVVIQISASLKPDPKAFSGFQWSSSSGPELEMSAGTTTSARVKISERAPITFVFPILRSLSGIY